MSLINDASISPRLRYELPRLYVSWKETFDAARIYVGLVNIKETSRDHRLWTYIDRLARAYFVIIDQ